MPIFKQVMTKYVKRRAVLLALTPTMIALIFSAVGWLISGFRWQPVVEFLVVSSIFLIPLSLIMAFAALMELEWFYIYEDRIEARGVLGCKNVVFYKNVEYVEERMLPLNIRDCVTPHYIFHDGRKNSGGILEHTSSPNKKKYTLRIYKTAELESYLVNTLHFEVRKTKTQWDALP